MAGRKPTVSARQLKARMQISIRATDKDVAQNSEKNRLIDMTQSMIEAGVMQEFLLDCLRSKLRQDEGQTVAAYQMFEGGQPAHPQRPSDSQIHYQQPHVPVAQSPAYSAPIEPVAVDEHVVSLPVSQGQGLHLAPAPAPAAVAEVEVEARTGVNESHPSTIIEKVVRGLESAATSNEAGFTASAPTERRRPKGNMLGAMG